MSHGIQARITNQSIGFYAKGLDTSIMEVPIDSAFLQAGIGAAKVKYSMASFKFDTSIQSRCENQTIQEIKEEKGSLFIIGVVFGSDCSSGYKIQFTPKSPRELDFVVRFDDLRLNRVYFSLLSSPDESVFGFGEQFSNFDLKGKKPFLFTEEQGIGRGDQPITTGANITAGAGGNEYTSYAPIPHYITTKHRSMFYENTGYSVFDMEDEKYIKLEFWNTNLEGGLKGTGWIATNPQDLIKEYTAKTGRMPELPDWAYGTILGLQGGSTKVTKVVSDAKLQGNPVTAIWIQDWCGRRVTNFGDQLAWRWYADERLYPDFKKFVQEMNSKNVKVLGYINPFLADTDTKKKGGDDFTNPMLAEARKKGYLVKNPTGEDYLIQTVGFPAYLIDLTNPEAVRWTKDVIKKNMIGMGLSGWMADFGEWLPYDAVLHSGVSAKNYHNQYPVDWAKLNREAITEAGKEGQIVFFTRAGYSYSNKSSTLFWLGDQMVSFQTHDGLPSAVLGMITSGISGISLNHSDIGGYTTISHPLMKYNRSKELLLRWAEMSVFSPVFRTHEGNQPLKNWQAYQYKSPEGVESQSDEDTVKRFAQYGKMHFAIQDYLKYYAKEAAKTGMPLVRHLYLHYPNDPEVRKLKYQYLLGEDLLVLPVVESGVSTVRGYLPAGQWKHIGTKEVYEGGTYVTVSAPIGNPAAFIRLGGKTEKLLSGLLTF